MHAPEDKFLSLYYNEANLVCKSKAAWKGATPLPLLAQPSSALRVPVGLLQHYALSPYWAAPMLQRESTEG